MSNQISTTSSSSSSGSVKLKPAPVYLLLQSVISYIFNNASCNKNEFKNTCSAIKALPLNIKTCIFKNMSFSELMNLMYNLDLSIEENIEVKISIEDILVTRFKALFNICIDKTNLHDFIYMLAKLHNHFISKDERLLLFDDFRSCQNVGDLLDVLKQYSTKDLLNLTCYFTFVQDLDEANMLEILISMLAVKYSKENPKQQLQPEKLAILLQIILKTSLNFNLTNLFNLIDALPFAINSIKVYQLLSKAIPTNNIDFIVSLLKLIIKNHPPQNVHSQLIQNLNYFIITIACLQDLSILKAVFNLIPKNMIDSEEIIETLTIKLAQFIGTLSDANLRKPREALEFIRQNS